MDPLSITAGTIGVCQAADRLLGIISQIKRYCHSLKEVDDLRHEISRLQLVIDSVKSILEDHTFAHRRNIFLILEHCEDVVKSLERQLILCSWARNKIPFGMSQEQCIRMSWLKRRGKVEGLRSELRDGIALLTLGLVVMTLSQSEARYIHRVPRQHLLSRIENRSDPESYLGCHGTGYQYLCFSTQFLGTLLMSASTKCLNEVCKDNQYNCEVVPRFSVLYYACQGSWIPSFIFTIAYPGRIHLSLAFPRVLLPDSEVFQCIRDGNVPRLKELLASGEASVADIMAPYGLTTLNLAIVHGQQEVIQLLVSEGAPQVPPHHNWRVGEVWEFVARNSLLESPLSMATMIREYRKTYAPEVQLKEMKVCIEAGGSDSANMSRLHKSVLGISCEDVSEIAGSCRPSINEADFFNRTPLFWAAALGKYEQVESLIKHGANPNIADVTGNSPLHAAASNGSPACIRRLISAGANIEYSNRGGTTPFHQACLRGKRAAVETLLDLGANIGSANYLGETAVSYAIHGKHCDILDFLICRGASLQHIDSWGFLPMLDAVFLNSHAELQYLLSIGVGAGTRTWDGKNLLHIAASNSDLRTIEILSGAGLKSLHPYEKDNVGFTPLDYLRRRRNSDELIEGFGSLIASVEASIPGHDG